MTASREIMRSVVADILDNVRSGWREAVTEEELFHALDARMRLIVDVLRRASEMKLVRQEPPTIHQLGKWAEEIESFEDLVRLVQRLADAYETRKARHTPKTAARPSPFEDQMLASEATLADYPQAAAEPGARSRGGARAELVDIHYVTDRHPSPDARLGTKFGYRRAAALTYGQCTVSLPPGRRVAQLPRPAWWRLEFTARPERHAVLTRVDRQDAVDFYASLRTQLRSGPRSEVLVFVHGFNVTFEAAALRTAQLAVDLRFDGAPILYSWPARGNVLDYTRDTTSADASAVHFLAFLGDVAQRAGAETVHVLAHSMGNRAVCRALHLLSQRGEAAAAARIGHLILAAPDMDTAELTDIGAEIRRTAASMTLYASSKDLALRLSKFVNGGPRAGEPILVLPDIDSIDASTVDTDFLAHGYFSADRSVLGDLNALLSGKPAADRFELEAVGVAPGLHYRFRP